METFIPIIWFLFLLVIPFALLVIGYISYLSEAKISEILLKLFLAFLGYFFITSVTIPFMFVLVFAGAHSKPVGHTLDTKGEILYSAIVLGYGFIGWLLCSFANGGFIKPWLIFSWERKTESSFDGK